MSGWMHWCFQGLECECWFGSLLDVDGICSTQWEVVRGNWLGLKKSWCLDWFKEKAQKYITQVQWVNAPVSLLGVVSHRSVRSIRRGGQPQPSVDPSLRASNRWAWIWTSFVSSPLLLILFCRGTACSIEVAYLVTNWWCINRTWSVGTPTINCTPIYEKSMSVAIGSKILDSSVKKSGRIKWSPVRASASDLYSSYPEVCSSPKTRVNRNLIVRRYRQTWC
jgi:hypothetical protein